MKARLAVLALAIPLAFALGRRAHSQAEFALAGTVMSADEGPMEGVIVGARKTGSTQTISVVSDQAGRYRFPAARLEPGQYALAIRAIGYDIACSFTNCCTVSLPPSSRLTPTTLKPCGAYSVCSFCSSGIS